MSLNLNIPHIPTVAEMEELSKPKQKNSNMYQYECPYCHKKYEFKQKNRMEICSNCLHTTPRRFSILKRSDSQSVHITFNSFIKFIWENKLELISILLSLLGLLKM